MKLQTLRGYLSTSRRYGKVAGSALALTLALGNAAFAQSACDLDGSGTVNSADVNSAVSMALGTTPCSAKVEGLNTCTVVTVQRVVNTALGQPCVTYNSTTHTVGLVWLVSPSTGVVGYNIYRRTTPAGAPQKLNTTIVAGTAFTDASVQLGQTYYYSATAADSSGLESIESSQATAVIPLN